MKDKSSHAENRVSAEELREGAEGLAPADVFDPVIEAYKKDVDRTLLRENLKLTTQQRSEKFVAFMKSVYAIRGKANPGLKVWR